MTKADVRPNLICYNAVLSACDRGGRAEVARELLGRMRKEGVRPDAISYSLAVSSCAKAECLTFLQELLGHKEASGEFDPGSFCTVVRSAQKVGLHRRALQTIRCVRRHRWGFTSEMFRLSLKVAERANDTAESTLLLEEMREPSIPAGRSVPLPDSRRETQRVKQESFRLSPRFDPPPLPPPRHPG
eukprot:Hpha_TRINITY_DN16_c0_g1::TRINITY_DN16_c0_g1_i1::g.110125::m.110125